MAARNKLMGAKVNPAPKKGPASGAPKAPAGRAGRAMDEERRYLAESAMNTIAQAHEHMSDKKLMADVKKMAMEKSQRMAEIAKKC